MRAASGESAGRENLTPLGGAAKAKQGQFPDPLYWSSVFQNGVLAAKCVLRTANGIYRRCFVSPLSARAG